MSVDCPSSIAMQQVEPLPIGTVVGDPNGVWFGANVWTVAEQVLPL